MIIKRTFIITIVAFVLISTVSCRRVQSTGYTGTDDNEIERAFKTRTSNVQVKGEGMVTRLLQDDVEGSRHQRFIVRLSSGLTVLILHNIDIAPRVDGLQEGDRLGFYGEYIWNSQGGKVHWTHRDPDGKHVAGWLKHNERIYQ